MKNLETLINELCPDGVEFKPLWQVTAWDKKFNGVEKKWQQKIISYPYVLAKVFDEIEEPSGNVKLLSTGISDKERWTTEEKAGENLSEGEIVAIPWGGTPNVKYYKGKFVTADNRIATSLDCSILNNKFLYYWLNNNIKKLAKLYRGAGIQHPSMKGVLSLDIPLPPIEVQTEIVRILDKFTELEAEMEAELDCRKRQYEYYRDKLLSFENVGGQDVEWKKMSEVIYSINTGLNPRRFFRLNTIDAHNYYVTIKEMKNGNIVFNDDTDMINDDALKLCNNRSHLEKGDLIFSGTGTIGQIVVLKETPTNWNIKEGLYSLKPIKEKIDSKYMAYILNETSIRKTYMKKALGGTVKSVPMKVLTNIKIPIPPLAEQERIVSILDRFESLTTSLTAGLPAEIAARRQQYEHYRDKLLTFKRKSA